MKKTQKLTSCNFQANEVLSESRLKEIAEEKQQLMNKDFRSILKAPILITCPKIGQSTQCQENQITDINVAQPAIKSHRNKQQTHEQDFSSDSSHSFLLDYVTARTNNINNDIDRCRNEAIKNNQSKSKIDSLVELLNRVNGLRRILFDEIKQSNGDLRIDANKFINSIDEVEQRQNEIMKERTVTKSATNTNTGVLNRKLTERERILKMKEECIDEKARELYLREKKLKDQAKKSNVASVNTATDRKKEEVVETLSDELPVRIVINVNKKGGQTVDPVIKDPKWCERLKKTAEIKENISTVPVIRQGKIYPKTPGKVKLTSEANKEYDILSQSTTVTAYLSPPGL